MNKPDVLFRLSVQICRRHKTNECDYEFSECQVCNMFHPIQSDKEELSVLVWQDASYQGIIVSHYKAAIDAPLILT